VLTDYHLCRYRLPFRGQYAIFDFPSYFGIVASRNGRRCKAKKIKEKNHSQQMCLSMLINYHWKILAAGKSIRILWLALHLAGEFRHLIIEVRFQFVDGHLAIFRCTIGIAL
jgi:hypothetical protein